MALAKNIYLVGFMGTGKSAVARLLSCNLKRETIDLDTFIEEREKRKITNIFTKDGEAYFRKVEKKLLEELSGCKDLIVSCGGGVVLDEENIKIMKENGIIICLYARPEVILKRTKGSGHRPLLNVANPKEKIEELLVLRAPFYAKADYTIDSSDIGVSTVVDFIIKNILPNALPR